MQEGFIKYGKNKAVEISSIQSVEEDFGMGGVFISFVIAGIGKQIVEKEYEPAWRERFELND